MTIPRLTQYHPAAATPVSYKNGCTDKSFDQILDLTEPFFYVQIAAPALLSSLYPAYEFQQRLRIYYLAWCSSYLWYAIL